MSEEIKMSNFEIPKSVTHFMYESDEHRAHFLQVDETGNVFAEFVPSVNYIGWDFDIEPYPLPVNAIPVSAYCEINRLAEENKRLREFACEVKKFTYITMHTDSKWLSITLETLYNKADAILAKHSK